MKKTFQMVSILLLAGIWCVGCGGENEPAMIQTFAKSDVAVIPEIEEYDFTTAKDMAVMDFDGNYVDKEVTGHQGWNPSAYPRSYVGMDESWDYAGKDYEWSDQFDCVMIADIDLGEDAMPVYLALLVKDDTVAAITFYCPTAG